jgi:hypothetical protein
VIFFRHLNDDHHHLSVDHHHYLSVDHHPHLSVDHHRLNDDCHLMFLSFWLFSYSFYDGTKVSYAKEYHSKLLLIMLLLHGDDDVYGHLLHLRKTHYIVHYYLQST